MHLQNAHWPELRDIAGRIFVVPLGSLEQHGSHMPLFTDSLIVTHVAEGLEKRSSDKIVLLPTQWLGHSPHHRHFGCVSLDLYPYIEMIRGICASLVNIGARKILLLNGHGGNDIPCKAALRELKSQFEDMPELYIAYAAYWNLAAEEFAAIRESPLGGIGHACEMETSVLLSKHPELVLPDKARRGGQVPGFRTVDMFKVPPFFMINEFDELSENGVIGMPDFATAEKGDKFLDAAVNGVVRFIDEFAKWDFQKKFTLEGRA